MADEAGTVENPVSSSLRQSTRFGGALPVRVDSVDDSRPLDDDELPYGAMVKSRCSSCSIPPWRWHQHDDVDE